jgi:N-methylhydantoinase B/oxoprolinase/acetone carboxylase alpha subunit
MMLTPPVKYQMKLHSVSLKPGDVLLTNSPHAGGSAPARYHARLPPVIGQD